MKVSVIIPAYNAEKWVTKCLESIINQNYKNLEIIVLNDGSTDGTLPILNAFKERDVRISVIDKMNSGTYLTRKEGIALSTGDVIFHADADDFLQPDAIKGWLKKWLKKCRYCNRQSFRGATWQKKLIRNKVPKLQSQRELVKCLLNDDIKGYIWKLFKGNYLTV